MNSKNIAAYISQADGDFVSVKNLDPDIGKLVTDFGFQYKEADNCCRIHVTNDVDKARLLEQLRDLDIYFSDGKEWCPCEIFEHFRDKGLTHGKYTKIIWIAPNSYRIFPDQ